MEGDRSTARVGEEQGRTNIHKKKSRWFVANSWICVFPLFCLRLLVCVPFATYRFFTWSSRAWKRTCNNYCLKNEHSCTFYPHWHAFNLRSSRSSDKFITFDARTSHSSVKKWSKTNCFLIVQIKKSQTDSCVGSWIPMSKKWSFKKFEVMFSTKNNRKLFLTQLLWIDSDTIWPEYCSIGIDPNKGRFLRKRGPFVKGWVFYK